MAAAFVGNYVVEKKENFDGFMKGIGVPDEYIEKARNAKVETNITVNGDAMTVVRTRPMKTTTNSFTFGQESEIETIKGDKLKVTVNLEEGKVVCRGPQYEVIQELEEGLLKETITFKGHTLVRFSKKQ